MGMLKFIGKLILFFILLAPTMALVDSTMDKNGIDNVSRAGWTIYMAATAHGIMIVRLGEWLFPSLRVNFDGAK